MWSDSPAPTPLVVKELAGFRKHLNAAGIHTRTRLTQMANFAMKRWVVVAKADYTKAVELARQWMEENETKTRYCHLAD
jgi:hypothetical protein